MNYIKEKTTNKNLDINKIIQEYYNVLLQFEWDETELNIINSMHNTYLSMSPYLPLLFKKHLKFALEISIKYRIRIEELENDNMKLKMKLS